MNPIGITFPLAAITAMLYLVWSDATRGRTKSRLVLVIRMTIFLGVIGALVWNRIQYPGYFQDSLPSFLFALAIAVALLGGAYYLRRVIGREKRQEEPLPRIFPGAGRTSDAGHVSGDGPQAPDAGHESGDGPQAPDAGQGTDVEKA